jgi:hypothetical protein
MVPSFPRDCSRLPETTSKGARYREISINRHAAASHRDPSFTLRGSALADPEVDFDDLTIVESFAEPCWEDGRDVYTVNGDRS